MQKEGVVAIGLTICLLIVLGVVAIKLPRTAPRTTPTITRLSYPPLRTSDPTQGPERAPVTIIVYSDFACESCAALASEIDSLKQDAQFKNKLRMVWKDFPVHERSIPQSFALHRAARCAATAGKFWQFERAAFAHNTELRLGQNVLPAILQAINLDLARVQPCLTSPAIEDVVRQNMDDARALGITATPTYFINQTRMEGVVSYAQLRGVVKSILATAEYENRAQ